jgi:hypothetical protein
MDELKRVRETADPLDRVQAATQAVSAYQDAINELGLLRREAVDELRAQGWTLTEIADKAGVSRARLSQLSNVRPSPERALLSSGPGVTIAVPVERASYPDRDNQRPVIHREDAEFVERISGLAKSYGLESHTEYVGPDDFLDMNRDGLVVTCGPRQSPWLEQVLTADTNYGFEHDEQGWYLHDKTKGQRYRSPEDDGEPSDYGYLGLLPRPDGQGAWLYAAGIHAAGSRGTALYLEHHLKDLYDQTRGVLWSCLIRCDYRPDTRDLISAEVLAPVRKRSRIKPRKRPS